MNTPLLPHPNSGHRFWQAHIKALAKSGFSRSEYCRRHDLSYHALTYWLRKHRSAKTKSSLALVEVTINDPLPSPRTKASLRLHLGSSYMVELEPDFNETTLRRVLVLLGSIHD